LIFIGLYHLVGGAITILKNDGVKVNGKDGIPYMKWKIIQIMFQTTNQSCCIDRLYPKETMWISMDTY